VVKLLGELADQDALRAELAALTDLRDLKRLQAEPVGADGRASVPGGGGRLSTVEIARLTRLSRPTAASYLPVDPRRKRTGALTGDGAE
jgi:hypothetical protein